MKNCKEKFDERMRENFGKEKSRKVFQAGYSKAYRLLSCVPTWKKLMDVLINTVLWFVIVKVFNHIDPIEEGLYKGTNSFIYLAKSLPLTLAFYPIGAYVSRCLLNRKYNRCSYIQKFGVWPKIFLFSAVWIGIIAQMDAYAPRNVYYLFICIPVIVQFWPELMLCWKGLCRVVGRGKKEKSIVSGN